MQTRREKVAEERRLVDTMLAIVQRSLGFEKRWNFANVR